MDREKRVLIIEDDPNIVDLLSLHLKDLGYEAECAGNGTEGLQRALSGEYILVILDLMLPGMDGLTVCRKIREKKQYTPILMLTAKADDLDKIIGLELGADDYITKPFNTRELIARIKAIVRRVEQLDMKPKAGKESEVNTIGALTIDAGKRQVIVSDKPVELTAKEFDLLTLLAANPGQAFSRQQLLSQVWGYQYEGYSHTVNSHINRLRNKIEKDPGQPEYIETVWGFGYRFADIREG